VDVEALVYWPAKTCYRMILKAMKEAQDEH
jgi:hypothetical protein